MNKSKLIIDEKWLTKEQQESQVLSKGWDIEYGKECSTFIINDGGKFLIQEMGMSFLQISISFTGVMYVNANGTTIKIILIDGIILSILDVEDSKEGVGETSLNEAIINSISTFKLAENSKTLWTAYDWSEKSLIAKTKSGMTKIFSLEEILGFWDVVPNTGFPIFKKKNKVIDK